MQQHSDRLLAKSCRDNEEFRPSMLLIGHLQDVYQAAIRVLDATGVDQLHAVGLNPEQYLPRLRRCILLAAAVHDLGKANDHFQGMIHGTRNILQNPQGVRHEWVTIVMLRELKLWLLPAVDANETDFSIVEWAIAGHHPAPHHESPPRAPAAQSGVELTALLGHKDAAAIFDWIANSFPQIDRALCPALMTHTYQLAGGRSVFDDIGRSWRAATQVWRKVKETPDRKFAAVVKNCLIAADIAGSALAKAMPDDPDCWAWISASFSNKPEPAHLKTVISARLAGKLPRAFQERVAASTSAVTFVKAGCGTGKTLAAYMWAARNHPGRRLYFCYPTTGTATEGFKDYLYEPDGELGDIGAKLFHSRREIDFEIILSNGDDTAPEPDEVAAKLESLEAWSTPIAACTVDTVLGVLQNNRKGLFAWPALAQSAFVFDEIHSYDNRLFGALLRFITDLPGLPVLLMTASLPKPREEALRQTLAERGIEWSPIDGPEELERLPRYHRTSAPDGPDELVAKQVGSGDKVLRVCNTVDRVIAAAAEADKQGLSPLVYHSRFRYIDRVSRHKAVIDAFSDGNIEPALAICSQVAEMSLDIKGCTSLITDEAPVPSEIQRLGRLNRQAEAGNRTRPFCVVKVERSAPYSPEDLEAARQWFAKLPDGPISQRDLAEQWEQTADNLPEPVESAWLNGGPTTVVRELRELSPGISVLMRDDAEILKKAKGNDADIGRYVIPMPNPPREMRWREWDNYKGIPIAEPSFIDYDRKRGGQWRQSSNQPSRII